MQLMMETIFNYVVFRRISCFVAMGCFMLLFAFKSATAQDDYKLINAIPAKSAFLTTDFLKNAYLINDKNQVMKYDSTGTLISVFSENKYGQLTSVDATSPFNVLMFYRDLATLVTADIRLNTKRLYKLSSVGINNVAAACLSQDNYIWLFDTDANKLKKINTTYETIYESLDLTQVLGEAIVPSFMIERDGLIYVNVPKYGVLMFDIMGNYYNAITASDIGKFDLNSFQVINRKIVYYDQGVLNVIDPFSRDKETIVLPKTDQNAMVKLERGNIYILDSKELRFYALIR